MSETAEARKTLSPFCEGLGIDIGFGGDPINKNSITFDLPNPYTKGKVKQILQGNCKSLNFICDEVFDYVYSSHVLEDFTYQELPKIIKEWRRILKVGGFLVINCPDQQRFLSHCKKTGQSINYNHKESDFSLQTFTAIVEKTGMWQTVFTKPFAGNYSWYLVLRKINYKLL